VRGVGSLALLLPCSIGTLLFGVRMQFIQFVVPRRLGVASTIMWITMTGVR
jgi:hypothetical protein